MEKTPTPADLLARISKEHPAMLLDENLYQEYPYFTWKHQNAIELYLIEREKQEHHQRQVLKDAIHALADAIEVMTNSDDVAIHRTSKTQRTR